MNEQLAISALNRLNIVQGKDMIVPNDIKNHTIDLLVDFFENVITGESSSEIGKIKKKIDIITSLVEENQLGSVSSALLIDLINMTLEPDIDSREFYNKVVEISKNKHIIGDSIVKGSHVVYGAVVASSVSGYIADQYCSELSRLSDSINSTLTGHSGMGVVAAYDILFKNVDVNELVGEYINNDKLTSTEPSTLLEKIVKFMFNNADRFNYIYEVTHAGSYTNRRNEVRVLLEEQMNSFRNTALNGTMLLGMVLVLFCSVLLFVTSVRMGVTKNKASKLHQKLIEANQQRMKLRSYFGKRRSNHNRRNKSRIRSNRRNKLNFGISMENPLYISGVKRGEPHGWYIKIVYENKPNPKVYRCSSKQTCENKRNEILFWKNVRSKAY